MPRLSGIKKGCHRGFGGCTDNSFYQFRDIQNLQVENTLASFEAAYDHGAAYFECDAVNSRDGVGFFLHNVKPEDHFFGKHIPPKMLNQMNWLEIDSHATGRFGRGKIATMRDTFAMVAKRGPKILPWTINIEIKGVQGSGQKYDGDVLTKVLEKEIKESPLPPDDVLFSSFCENVLESMSHVFPQAKYGMLFAEKQEREKPIYADHQDDPRYRYRQFTVQNVDLINREWRDRAHPNTVIDYVHPEIMTVDEDMIQACADRGLGINAWALYERLDAARVAAYQNVADLTAKKKVPFTIITDYLREWNALKAA